MVYKRPQQSNKTIEFLKLANMTKLTVINEISLYQEERSTTGTLNQLNKILSEIDKMSEKLSPKEFTPSYPHIIIDSWDFNNILGNQLLELNEKYKKLS